MRRFRWLPLLLVLGLAACSPGGSGFRCDGDICVHLEIVKPVRALEPTLVTVTVRTTKDVPRLAVNLDCDSKAAIQGPLTHPEGAEIRYQKSRIVTWRLDAKAGEAYTFSAYMIFEQPRISYGAADYLVRVLAIHPSMGVASDLASIYLDANGNQVDASKVSKTQQPLEETVYFGTPPPTDLPTATPRLTWTPAPTPTDFPTRTPTPTRMMGHPTRNPLATPFLPPITPPYPYPQP